MSEVAEKVTVSSLASACKKYVSDECVKLKANGAFSKGVDAAGKSLGDHAAPQHVLDKLVSQWWGQNSGAVEKAFLESVS